MFPDDLIKHFEKILDKAWKYGYNNASEWGLSSAGRASALQAEGHRFEPCRPHYPGSDKLPGFIHYLYGGVAQLVRAHGSYPWCRWFDSSSRY